jgi:predicted permease
MRPLETTMPNWKEEIRTRLAGTNLEPTRQNEIIDELSQHLDDRYAELISCGTAPEQACLEALAELSDSGTLSRELLRIERRAPPASEDLRMIGTNRRTNMIADVWQDLRYGTRLLLKNKGFTLVATLSLALSIGANTSIFSLIDALLLRPLPVKDPNRLVVVNTTVPGSPGRAYSSFSYPVFREMQEKNTQFSGMIARSGLQMSVSTEGQAERVLGELVSGSFFSTLGVNPRLGRMLTEADDQTRGAHPVAVISFNYWKRRFAEDPQIIGRTMRLNDYPFTIIGVAEEGFHGVEVGVDPDVRIPLVMDGQVRPRSGGSIFEQRGSTWLALMARLKPNVTVEQAQAGTDTIFQIARAPDVQQIRGETPDDRGFRAQRIQLDSARSGASNLSRQFAEPLIVLMCLVGVVLLIACLNVANLLLARATSRRKEIAVRLALGAGRSRVVRQLLTEGLLLSAFGGLLGLFFARWGTDLLLTFLPRGRTLEVRPDLRVLGFTVTLTLLTGIIFALAPALRMTRPDLIPSLKNDHVALTWSGRRWELGRLLVILQVALSLVLLVGAGLFVRSLQNLKSVDMGYHADEVVTMAIDPAQIGYKIDRLRNFYDELTEHVSALPGVKGVSFARNVPMSGSYSRFGIEVPGYDARPGEEMAVLFNQVAPQFFATFGTLMLLGRDFSARDTPESPKVVIINQSLSRRFFGSGSPLGKHLTLENYKDLEIVGVAADAKYRNLQEAVPHTAYVPYSQYEQTGQRTMCVRASGDPVAIVAAIRQEVRNLDSNLPVFNVRTFAEQIDESVSTERLVAMLSTFFGIFALLLASLGLYGVMAYGVACRTNEIGIRLSLGAQRRNVVWLVMRESLLLVAIGVVVGLVFALAASRMVGTLLFDLTATDPLTIALATCLMVLVGGLAGYVPARRAARVDPLIALRSQ